MPLLATAEVLSSLPVGFTELYEANYDFVWRCAMRLGAAPADVEDIVQETFVIALRRYDPLGFVDGDARPSTWLFSILRNVLRNHTRGERRRRARLEALAEIVAENEPGPAASDTQSVLGMRLLDEFLGELEPDRREIFVLAELEGMRGPEIARTLELNPNTVRSRLRAARQAFHERFGDEHAPIVEAAANETAPPEARARGSMVLLLLARMLDPIPTIAPAATPAPRFMSITGMRIAATVGLTSVLVVVALLPIARRWRPLTDSERVEVGQPVTADQLSATADQPDSLVAAPDEGEPSPIIVPAEPVALAAEPRRKPPSTLDHRTPLEHGEALERLAHARSALLQGYAAACLELVKDPRGWPPSLDARRVALQVGALCALGRSDRARSTADAWLAAHPDASTAVDLRNACWTDGNNPTEGGHQATNGPDAREEQ